MNSTIGRRPAIAAPTPKPANPSSVIGVSMTRFGPNSSSNPRVTLYAPWYSATSSPMRNTSPSRANSSRRAWFSASRMVITAISQSSNRESSRICVNVRVQLFRIWLRTLFSKAHSLLNLLFDRRFHIGQVAISQHFVFLERGREKLDRIALLIFLNFGARAIVAGVGHRMTHVAIGARLEQCGQRFLAGALDRALRRAPHRHHVHSVDKL